MNRLILLAGLLGLAASGFADTPHTFIYRPADHPRKVDIAGTFNNWSDTANPMQPRSDGSFVATLTLPDGIYQYKFVVNGDQWLSDPNDDKELEDPADTHHNSAVMVGPDARNAPKPAANQIVGKWVIFHPADTSDVNVATPHLLRLRLRTLANNVDSVAVRMWGSSRSMESMQPMYKISTSMGLDTYACFVEANQSSLDYVFELHDGTSVMDEAPSGLEHLPSPGTPGEGQGGGMPDAPHPHRNPPPEYQGREFIATHFMSK